MKEQKRKGERQGKRPQILFQVKGFLSRHLPRAREPVKIKMTSRNVFSLSRYFPSRTSWREPTPLPILFPLHFSTTMENAPADNFFLISPLIRA